MITTFPKSEPIQLIQTEFFGKHKFLTVDFPKSVNALFVSLICLTFISSEGVKNGMFPP